MGQQVSGSSRNGRIFGGVMFALAVVIAPLQSRPADAHDANGDRNAYVLMAPNSDSSTMSGSMDDIRRAKALRHGREGLLYVRQGGVSYVIRDAETLRRAQAIFEPQERVGNQQAALGSQQADLGSKQAQLGMQQARLGMQQADARPSRAAALAEQQAALGRQQDALGERQNVLGRQQEALGREQERLAHEADAKFQALLSDAIRRNVAQRVN